MMDVYSLALEDTRLSKESVHSLAGPCPDTSCRCQTNGFYIKWSGGQWRFACRGCWEPSEVLSNGRKRGMGDTISYLCHYRGNSYRQARALVDGNEDGVAPSIPESTIGYQSDKWQIATNKEIESCVERLHSEDTMALAYARSRGFTDETISKFKLGYSLRNGIPRITIPSINDKQYVAVYRRDLRPDIPKGERWKDAPGGTKRELYLADSLLRKDLPVVLVEDAFSALSIWQDADDMVNTVATGGTKGARLVKWVARLARAPLVLVAFDADAPGDEESRYWLDRLPNSRRLRPLLKDANDMLMAGYDIKDWISQAINGNEAPSLCSLCSNEVEYLVDDGSAYGVPYCEPCYTKIQIPTAQENSVTVQDEQIEYQPITSKEQFDNVAQQLKEALDREVASQPTRWLPFYVGQWVHTPQGKGRVTWVSSAGAQRLAVTFGSRYVSHNYPFSQISALEVKAL